MSRKNQPATPAPNDPFISRAQIAAMYGVGVQSVFLWDKKGMLPPPIRLTRKSIRYRISEVRAALEKAGR
jgi:predicted DNA-binding transcriptional regulator AlpA